MSANSLTPHQREVLARLKDQYKRTGRPVPATEIGSSGALAHLRAKGRITLAGYKYGPRGGETRLYVPVEKARADS